MHAKFVEQKKINRVKVTNLGKKCQKKEKMNKTRNIFIDSIFIFWLHCWTRWRLRFFFVIINQRRILSIEKRSSWWNTCANNRLSFTHRWMQTNSNRGAREQQQKTESSDTCKEICSRTPVCKTEVKKENGKSNLLKHSMKIMPFDYFDHFDWNLIFRLNFFPSLDAHILVGDGKIVSFFDYSLELGNRENNFLRLQI